MEAGTALLDSRDSPIPPSRDQVLKEDRNQILLSQECLSDQDMGWAEAIGALEIRQRPVWILGLPLDHCRQIQARHLPLQCLHLRHNLGLLLPLGRPSHRR